MALTILSSREFDEDVRAASKASKNGPVIITDGGKPAWVLLSIGEYRKLTSRRESIGQKDRADSG